MVYLGGTAPKANIELHDVQFVVGKSIEETYPKLRENWFGSPKGLHLDSYKQVLGADGYEIEIKSYPQSIEEKLYFVNLGGYKKDALPEIHEFGLFVARSNEEAKVKALNSLLKGVEQQHKDELFEVDDCLEMNSIDGNYIHLKPSTKTYNLAPDWFGYNVIGK
jgi:hypothetical protein